MKPGLKLDTPNWAWFRLDKIFDIKKGKRLTKADMIPGNIPFLGAIDSNNGVMYHIANDEHIHSGNTITVNYNGSVGYAYYQKEPFWATDDVNVLYPKFELNEYKAMFICSIIQKERYRFNYGRKWHKERMNLSEIKLPIDKYGKPDWPWIEGYIKKQIVPSLPPKPKAVWNQTFNKVPLSKRIALNFSSWKRFRVGDILTCQTTPHIVQQDAEYGDTPLITRSATNNGISAYVNVDEKFIQSSNCITIGAEGVVAFYQQSKFTCGVKIYTLTNPKLNKYNSLFLITILNKEAYRYNYGRARILKQIKNENIKLPAKNDKEPDWQLMENYIKGLPYSASI